MVVVRTLSLYDVSVHATQQHAMNSGGKSPGASDSRRPRLPRPNGGGQPWPCACAQGSTKLHASCRRAQPAHRDVDHLVNEPWKTACAPCHDDFPASCNCGSTNVLSTTAPGNLHDPHNKSATVSTNWRISLVRQQSGPWEAASAYQQGREPARPATRDIDHLAEQLEKLGGPYKSGPWESASVPHQEKRPKKLVD